MQVMYIIIIIINFSVFQVRKSYKLIA